MMKVLQRNNMQSLFIVKNKRRKNGPRYLNPAGLPCCVLLVFDELMDDELTPWQPANTCHIHHVSKCISNFPNQSLDKEVICPFRAKNKCMP